MTVPPEWIRNPSDELAIAEGCWFDEEAGRLPCDFIESFCHQSKGSQWANRPLLLLDWQRDFLMRLFGWKRADGLRRFRRAYVEVPKKNGKTTLLAGLELYLLIADDDGPEIYINACDRNQASMMFDESARMVRSSPDLKNRLQVIDSRKTITFPARNGVIRANSAEAPNKDGLNSSGIIFDELHRQPDARLWDIFEHADASRAQPIWISITTAGEDESGVWYEQREYSERVNRGEVPDTTHLGVIYRADPADDIDDPATWYKANPSLGATISEESFRLKLTQAKETPRKLAEFKRLRLNIISKSDVVFILPEDWAACSSEPIDPASLKGLPCYAGGDLSRTIDLTALVVLWGDSKRGYDLRAWFYMPADNVDELARQDRQPYRFWIEQGWIAATPGAVVDYDFIRRDLKQIAAEHDLRQALVDPYNATSVVTAWREQDGLPVEFLRQGYLSLSPATKELERLVKARKLRHGDNPVLTWMAGNAVVETDAAGNVKLTKRKSRTKIDGMAALVNAVAAATAAAGGPSVYESRGILSL